jgi:hypothetical protein
MSFSRPLRRTGGADRGRAGSHNSYSRKDRSTTVVAGPPDDTGDVRSTARWRVARGPFLRRFHQCFEFVARHEWNRHPFYEGSCFRDRTILISIHLRYPPKLPSPALVITRSTMTQWQTSHPNSGADMGRKTRRPVGRPPIYGRPMSQAERQQRSRYAGSLPASKTNGRDVNCVVLDSGAIGCAERPITPGGRK